MLFSRCAARGCQVRQGDGERKRERKRKRERVREREKKRSLAGAMEYKGVKSIRE